MSTHPTASDASPRRPWSWRVGRVAGIDLRVHTTLVLLLVWIALAHLTRGHGVAVAGRALVLIAAVFAIVVLHELGHALTARRFGVRTREILLLPIGGVARLDRMPENPRHELLIAIAGPAVNALLAIALYAVLAVGGRPLEAPSDSMLGGALLSQLVWINVSLAVFNLLPAFPMDGGRVLRAVLALRLDYRRATRLAAKVGQGMAVALGVAGVWLNWMLILIAVFVWMGAAEEAAAVEVRAVLHTLPVRDAMISRLITLAPRDPIERAVQSSLAGFPPDFPVVDDGRTVGVLTRDDMLRGLHELGASAPVSAAMHTRFTIADPAEMLDAVLGRVGEEAAPAIVVAHDGQLLGLVTQENLGQLVLFQRAVQRGVAPP